MLYYTKINTGGYLITNLVAGGHRPHIPTVAVVYGFRDIVRWYYNKFSELKCVQKLVILINTFKIKIKNLIP